MRQSELGPESAELGMVISASVPGPWETGRTRYEAGRTRCPNYPANLSTPLRAKIAQPSGEIYRKGTSRRSIPVPSRVNRNFSNPVAVMTLFDSAF